MVDRTPAQWRDYLLGKLPARQHANARLRRYYQGDHVLPTAPDRTTEAYKRLAELGVTNMCGLIVDTVVERLQPKGVRLSATADADLDVWRTVWQANGLDAEIPVGFEEALKVGICPMLIWPVLDANGKQVDGKVSWTIEDPDETIVVYAPGSRRERLAALKSYRDADDGAEYATVWTPTLVESWTREKADGVWLRVEARSGSNPLGVVPVLELVTKRDVKGNPSPEISTSVIRLQDRINKTMFDCVVGAEEGAFPQRYTIGIEIEEDDEGNPVNPLETGPKKTWALDAQEGQESTAKIGQLEAFDVTRLIQLAETSIKQLAAVSKTSVFYVLAGLTNVGADTIRMADAAAAGKTRGHQTRFGGVLEDGFALALRALGREDIPDDIEIDWAPIEVRSPAEIADAAIKMSQAGYPFAAIARYTGATQSEIERIETERVAEMAAADGLDEIATAVQKLYLGVGKVISSDEARSIISSMGYSLPGSLPPSTAAPEPVPV